MTGARTNEVSDRAIPAARGKREDLRFSLAAVLHLLPGALLLGTALLLAPLTTAFSPRTPSKNAERSGKQDKYS